MLYLPPTLSSLRAESDDITQIGIIEMENYRNNFFAIVSQYEAEHPVQDYDAYGWLVWPYLKGIILGEHVISEKPSVNRAQQNVPTKQIGKIGLLFIYFRAFCSYLKWVIGTLTRNAGHNFCPCDVLVFGSGERYQTIGSRLVHYPTESIIQKLQGLGFKCICWHWNPPKEYTPGQALDVRPPFRWIVIKKMLLTLVRPKAEEPWWFAEFAAFHSTLSPSPLSWKTLARQLQEIAIMSELAGAWLKISKPRLVMLDWWLNGPMMATSLAAHRLGIPTMDLQHGLQEYDCLAYHGWTKEPAKGWPARPRLFWLWGQDALDRAVRKNIIEQTLIAGGNIWLNDWVAGKHDYMLQACLLLEHHRNESDLVVLVTLQGPEFDDFTLLEGLIQIAPSRWRWLVRCHPRMLEDPDQIAQRLGRDAGKDVHVHKSIEYSLYALLRTCDVHVTKFSTCANEAMAFGVPSVLFGDIAPALFRWGLSSGAMFYASNPAEIIRKIHEAKTCSREAITYSARRLFAGFQDTDRAITELVSYIDP